MAGDFLGMLNAAADDGVSMAPGNGVFFNNLSTLNAIGSASVIIAVPNIAALSGMTLYSAFVVEDPNATSWQLGTISPSLAITIQ